MSILWFSVLTVLITFFVLLPEDAYNFVTLVEEWIKHIPTAISYELMKQKLWWMIQVDRLYFRYRLWVIRRRHNRNETNHQKQE